MKTLQRSLNLSSVVAISVGAMLGSGLFVLPGLAVTFTGPSVWLAYLAAGICVLPAALSKAELGTAMPVSGGSYVYIDRTFGPLAGTIAGIGLWMALLLKSSFALVGLSTYLEVLVAVPLIPTALALLVAITMLNLIGVRKVGKVQLWVVGLAFVSLWGLWLLSVWYLGEIGSPIRRDDFPEGMDGFIAAAAFVYISYAGVTKVAAIAEEVKNPNRNIPAGILISLFAVMVVYAAVTYVLVHVVPMDALQGNLKPIHTLAEITGGPILGVIMAIIGILTMASMANSGLLASSRFPFAMSRDHLLPRIIAWIHPQYMTPAAGIFLTAATMGAAIVFLDVVKIAKLAGAMQMVAFIAENATVLVLRETTASWYKPSFRSPLYPWLQVFGILTGLVLLGYLGSLALAAVLGMAIPGGLIYVIYGRPRADRRGVVATIAPRRELLDSSPLPELGESQDREAAVVVPLFGPERSPETVVEVGAALAGNNRVEVLHLTDVPDQLMLDAMLDEDTKLRSLRRRIDAMCERREAEHIFDAVVTRDVVRTVYDVSRQVHCDWLVMQWQGRTTRDIFQFGTLNWLLNHLDCNLALFKDAGIRTYTELLVIPAPGPYDALVIDTADHLAELFGAKITLARFVPDDADPARLEAERGYLAQLAQSCTDPAEQSIVRGMREVDAFAAMTAGYDMLIMGDASGSKFWTTIMGTPQDRLTRRAACSVLRLKTPRGRTHEGMRLGTPRPSTTEGLRIKDFLHTGQLHTRLEVHRKEQLFTLVAEAFAEDLPHITAAEIAEGLWTRERTQNTAVGRGVALPHATIDTLEHPMIGIFTTVAPIDYQAPDGQRIDVFLVALSPPGSRNTHLHLLARLARLVLQTPLLDLAREATSCDGLMEAVLDCEPQLEA